MGALAFAQVLVYIGSRDYFRDDILGRKGRMVDAVAGIGKGVYAYPGSPFELGLKF